jgi:hypothetical protein
MPEQVASVAPPRQRKLERDLQLLASFVRVYCRRHHRDAPRAAFALRGHWPPPGARPHADPVELCAACRKLLAHAIVMRTRCPLDPKPACRKCPVHCYAPRYRTQMREVMRYSGRRLVLRGRLDYLLHLLR